MEVSLGYCNWEETAGAVERERSVRPILAGVATQGVKDQNYVGLVYGIIVIDRLI